MRKRDHRSGHQHHYHRAVFDVIARLERVIPMIEKLRHVSPNAKRQDQRRAELNKPSPHVPSMSLPWARNEKLVARNILAVLA